MLIAGAPIAALPLAAAAAVSPVVIIRGPIASVPLAAAPLTGAPTTVGRSAGGSLLAFGPLAAAAIAAYSPGPALIIMPRRRIWFDEPQELILPPRALKIVPVLRLVLRPPLRYPLPVVRPEEVEWLLHNRYALAAIRRIVPIIWVNT